MEEEDYKKTKGKLFARAMEGRKEFKNESNSEFTPGPGNNNQPPLNISLDYNPETDYKNVGVDYTKGKFNVGANYQPGFSTTLTKLSSFTSCCDTFLNSFT